jgi:hypothetical protein
VRGRHKLRAWNYPLSDRASRGHLLPQGEKEEGARVTYPANLTSSLSDAAVRPTSRA